MSRYNGQKLTHTKQKQGWSGRKLRNGQRRMISRLIMKKKVKQQRKQDMMEDYRYVIKLRAKE
jgi:hypothetical protein